MLPTSLKITDGAMAMDGGSISLMALDSSDATVNLSLDWSLSAQHNHFASLSANGVVVAKGSQEERGWLELIQNAEIAPEDATRANEGHAVSVKRLVLGQDIQDYFDAIEESPAAALHSLAARLVSVVSSAAYQR